MAYARIKKFANTLTDDSKLPASEDTSKLDANSDKEVIQAVEDNDLAVACLQLALNCQRANRCLSRTECNEWSQGKAKEAMDNLNKLYVPMDTIAKTTLRARLKKLSMNDNDDPKVLFEEIYDIEALWKTSAGREILSEDELKTCVLMAAPSNYTTELRWCEKQAAGSTGCTLFEYEDCMCEHFNIMVLKGEISLNKKNQGELGLAGIAKDLSGVKCYKCGEFGHYANKCPNKGKNNSGGGNGGRRTSKFNGTCNLCGKFGHMKRNCWELEANADKRPRGWKSSMSSSDVGNVAIDGEQAIEHPELSLFGLENDTCFMTPAMTFANSIVTLSDPNVWVCDTGATSHTTFSEKGLSNCKEANLKDKVNTATGESMGTKLIGDISGLVCDKYGTEVRSAKLQSVRYCPSSKYNLFSGTLLMKQGWRMIGDDKGIKFVRNNNELLFDIKITTPSGFIYCMYFKRKGNNAEFSVPAINSEGKRTIEKADVSTKAPRMSVQMCHDLMGHSSEAANRKTAKHIGWVITRGKLKPCSSCAAGKAKQKNIVLNEDRIIADKPGGRVYLDISTIKAHMTPDKPVSVPKSNWRLLVDEYSTLKFSNFFGTKNEMVKPTFQLFQK